MNPLLVKNGNESGPSAVAANMMGASESASNQTSNHRSTPSASQRMYPWLLSISTVISFAFCLLYMTKPVIVSSTGHSSTLIDDLAMSLAGGTPVAPSPEVMPKRKMLAEEPKKSVSDAPSTHPSDSKSVPTGAPLFDHYEETNLRVQHILTAEAPGGHLDRIDIDVPVIYQSRNLRWTSTEVAEARKLLARLMDYQEKSLHLRAEGSELLDSWNRLIGNSIPTRDLRADSPTLPANQQDVENIPRPAGLTTTDSIQIKTTNQ